MAITATSFLSVLFGYGAGMVVYHRDNFSERNRLDIFKNTFSALADEFAEAFQELRQFRCSNFLSEICDVWHTVVVLMVRTVLPKAVQNNRSVWCIAFFLAGAVTPWKHGARYLNHGCIRSVVHCRRKDHLCSNSNDTNK